MTAGTLNFDGVDYPDGLASDPNVLGLMQGTPPAPDKRVRFDDDRFLTFPRIRWSLSHMRELVPTVNVWRGDGAPSDMGTVQASTESAIDALRFADMGGRQRGWAE